MENKTPFTTQKKALEFCQSLDKLNYDWRIKSDGTYHWVLWHKKWQLPLFKGDFEQGRKFTDITKR
jgi:hypothetical protein